MTGAPAPAAHPGPTAPGSEPLDAALLATTRRAPKVLLHDHLDGGVRPQTVLDLAQRTGYDALPADDAAALGTWFRDAADSGSLERYLQTFAHTVGVMQTADALHRVAAECAQDLAADGVVYAEVRFAPELHGERGLAPAAVVEAVLAGFADGAAAARAQGHPVVVRGLLTAMRHADRSREIASLATDFRDLGVVGFDIAGAEDGHPAVRHLAAFEYLREQWMPFTVHAGEAYGLPSITDALQRCGAQRLGHGVRVVDDLTVAGRPVGELLAAGERVDPAAVRLGRVAHAVRDRQVPLEVCPSSNVQTGAAASVAAHPVTLLKDLGFRVTLNTDNRLMSGTSMSREAALLVRDAGWTLADLRRVTVDAMRSAFVHLDEREALVDDIVAGYAAPGV